MIFISKLDSQPSQFTLKFNQIEAYQSKTGGFFSLLIYVTIVIIIGYKLYDVAAKNHIYIYQQTDMNSYNYPINISDMIFSLLLEVRNDNQSYYIDHHNQYENGINVTLQQNYEKMIDGEIFQQVKTFEMKADSDYFFTIRNTPGIDNQLLGRVDFYDPSIMNGDVYKRLAIRILTCDQQVDPRCQPYKSNIFPSIIFRNNKINPQSHKQSDVLGIDSAYRTNEFLSELNAQESVSLIYYFKGVNVSTDQSIMPEIIHRDASEFQQKSSWIYDNQFTQDNYYIGQSNEELLKLSIKRSEYTIVYSRQYKKLDTLLAQIFGILGLLHFIRNCIMNDYNGWSFRKRRQEKMLGLQKENWNLLTFYRAKINDLKGKFRFEEKNETEEEFLDYYGLLRRIERFEKGEEGEKGDKGDDRYGSMIEHKVWRDSQEPEIHQLSQNLLNEQIK